PAGTVTSRNVGAGGGAGAGGGTGAAGAAAAADDSAERGGAAAVAGGTSVDGVTGAAAGGALAADVDGAGASAGCPAGAEVAGGAAADEGGGADCEHATRRLVARVSVNVLIMLTSDPRGRGPRSTKRSAAGSRISPTVHRARRWNPGEISTPAAVLGEPLDPIRRERIDADAVQDLHRRQPADERPERHAAVHHGHVDIGTAFGKTD